MLKEPAVVENLIYSPSLHSSDLAPTLSMSGKVGLAITSVSVPEKYAVVFRCQHGKFIIEGVDENHKKLWQRLTRDQKVIVSYKEVYYVTYKDDVVVSRELADYDFIDAK